MHELDSIPPGSTLGLNFSGLHDSAIAIVGPDGRVLFACALERLSRVKQDGRWPALLLDRVPWDRIERIAVGHVTQEGAEELGEHHGVDGWPFPMPGGKGVVAAYPQAWQELLAGLPRQPVLFDHHLCHAASAWFLSGFERGLIVTCDAGAHQCPWLATVCRAEDDEITLVGGMAGGAFWSPASFYTAVTTLIGLRPNRHEGKVTGLAARASVSDEQIARFQELITPMVRRLDSLLRWDMMLDNSRVPHLAVNERQRELWRHELQEFSDTELAACVQTLAERAAVEMVQRARELAGEDLQDVCLAGGLFSNVLINQKVVSAGFERGFIAPPMTDDGVALGAALLAHCRAYPNRSPMQARPTMFLGPSIENSVAEEVLNEAGIRYAAHPNLEAVVARHLMDNRTVAIARGRMEFGPRALGHRSVLYAPVDPEVNDWLNRKLKRTEYMPFAPMTLAAEAAACYGGIEAIERAARFMTVTANCSDTMARSCPAVVHVDGTARPQLVDAADEPFIHEVLREFHKLSGLATVLNTSFNIHEEPIVCSEQDALAGFAEARLDVLCLGDLLIERAGNEEALDRLASFRTPGDRTDQSSYALSRWLHFANKQLEKQVERHRQLERDYDAADQARVAAEAETAQLRDQVEEQEALLEVTQQELAYTRSALSLRLAIGAGNAYRGTKRRLLGAAQATARLAWRGLPAVARERIESRYHQGTLPRLAHRAVEMLRPGASPDPQAPPFDKIDVLAQARARVSVIIPCFNHGAFLHGALDSLAAQTYPFFEVIIVDDGSDDDATKQILDGLQRDDLKIRVIRQDNRGPGAARNAGIEIAEGEYILPLDADDTIEPSFLMRTVQLLDYRPDIGIAYTDFRFFGQKEELSQCPEYDLNALLAENFMVATSLFRKSLWREAGGYFDELREGYEDWCLWLDFAAMGWYGKRIPEPLFNYRIQDTGRNVAAVKNNLALIARIRQRNAKLYGNTTVQNLWLRRAAWKDPRPIASPTHDSEPLVTVLVPYYNYGRYVPDTIQSILDQTHKNVEIIILDDGSTDPDSVRLLEESEWPKTRIVRHENMGLAATRNRGFELAAGDFVLPVDADDILMPQMIEKCLEVMRGDQAAGWVYTDIRFFDHTNGVHKQESYNFALELTNNHSSVCALIRKSAWQDAGGYNPNMAKGYEDWDFWVSCSTAGWHGRLVDGAYFGYRMHGVSMITESLKHHQKLVNTIRLNHPVVYLPWNIDKIRTQWLPHTDERLHLPLPDVEHPPQVAFAEPEQGPLFTVIVPVFRHERYLEACLNSVLDQTFRGFELIAIDDGSKSPAIDEILAKYSEHEAVAVVANEANEGIARTLNKAIIAAKGAYICFLDCDDFLTEDALEQIRKDLLTGDTKHYLSTQILDVDEDDVVIRKRQRPQLPKDLLRGMFAGHMKVIKRTVFPEVGLLDEELSGCQDYDLVLRIQEGYPIRFLQKFLYNYRWHPATVSVSHPERQDELTAKIALATRYRRWLLDRSILKSFREQVAIIILGSPQASEVLSERLFELSCLPMSVFTVTPEDKWRLSVRRPDGSRTEADQLEAPTLEAMVRASGAAWITVLDSDMAPSSQWLEHLYFFATSRQALGVAPLIVDKRTDRVLSAGLDPTHDGWTNRLADLNSDDLRVMRIAPCKALPLRGSLFSSEFLLERVGKEAQIHAAINDSLLANVVQPADRFYAYPIVRLDVGAVAAKDTGRDASLPTSATTG